MTSMVGTYQILTKAGQLHNGAERGKGSIWHAVDTGGRRYGDTIPALCGARPAIMWSTVPGDAVTCPRCLRNVAATHTPA